MNAGGDHSRGQPPTVAVIGGGIIGLTIAWRMAQQGAAVTLFDSGSVGREASYAGAGMLAPGGEVEDVSSFARSLVEARGMYPAFIHELEQATGTTIDFQQGGALDLAYSDEEWALLQHRAGLQEQLGIGSRVVARSHVEAFWPRVRLDGLTGALFYKNDAVVSPRDILACLRIACVRAGVVLAEHTGVENVKVGPQDAACYWRGSSKCFDMVVMAAGAWSGSISVDGVSPLPATEPFKGHLVGYRQPLETCTTILRRGSTYIVQRASGLLIIGASVEQVGFDRSVNPEVVRTLILKGSAILAHLSETTPTEAWIGFRPGSEHLQVGPWYSPRFLLAYGHYRNGILLAPHTAHQMVQLFRTEFNLASHEQL